MALAQIDSIMADTLEIGDIIKLTDGYREIHSKEDFLTHILVITDNGEEISFQPDALVNIYLED